MGLILNLSACVAVAVVPCVTSLRAANDKCGRGRRHNVALVAANSLSCMSCGGANCAVRLFVGSVAHTNASPISNRDTTKPNRHLRAPYLLRVAAHSSPMHPRLALSFAAANLAARRCTFACNKRGIRLPCFCRQRTLQTCARDAMTPTQPTRPVDAWNASLNTPLCELDPEVHRLIHCEMNRQYSCLELIASENFTSEAVMEANGSALTNKYSEGLPAARYYGGNEYIDLVENLCRNRALEAFELDPTVWGVNVQPYSGSQANFAAFTAVLAPHDRIMGLDLPSGGHLTHGYQTAKKKISASAIYFESMGYRVDPKTGMVDYDSLETQAAMFRPRLIICGASAYAREWDYKRLRKIADQHGAYLMADIAHIAGLIAGKEQDNAFDYADIVTTTTHKTLRGPRAGLIFFKKTAHAGDLEARVNAAVFPATQGGPHNNTIAAIAVALKQAASPEFKNYARQVRVNAKALADALIKLGGHKIVTSGTDNHIVLWDLRPHGLTGNKLETLCDQCSITLNKNTIHGDTSALRPGGVRLGTPALTSRSFREPDFEQVAMFLHRAYEIAAFANSQVASEKLKDFSEFLKTNEQTKAQLLQLKKDVELFARQFPMPGFNPSAIEVSHE